MNRKRRIRCRHFSGTQHKACKLGYRYDSVAVAPEEPGMALRLPCLVLPTTEHDRRGTCAYYSEVTQTEDDARSAEITEWLAHTKVARLSIIDALLPEDSGVTTVGCPKCGGALHGSRSSLNGHVHGRCETEGCLSWME